MGPPRRLWTFAPSSLGPEDRAETLARGGAKGGVRWWADLLMASGAEHPSGEGASS